MYVRRSVSVCHQVRGGASFNEALTTFQHVAGSVSIASSAPIPHRYVTIGFVACAYLQVQLLTKPIFQCVFLECTM